jgi:hypothetical protein
MPSRTRSCAAMARQLAPTSRGSPKHWSAAGRPELILRCSDTGVAVRSLAALFGVTPDRLARALPEAAAAVEADAEAEMARAIVPALAANLGGPPVTPSRVHFFHGTRAFEPQLFAQRGLLPLPAVLDDLWERMQGLAPEIPSENFAAVRAALEDGRIEALTYKHRADTRDDGPNGVLVRDVLLNPRAYHSSEFVRIPEIVEDICVAVRNELHVDLEQRFERAATPCVVEFTTHPREPHRALTAACWYAEAAQRGKIASGDELRRRRRRGAGGRHRGRGRPAPLAAPRPDTNKVGQPTDPLQEDGTAGEGR